MSNVLKNPFIKSLVPFTISLLRPWIKKTLIEASKQQTSMLPFRLHANENAETANNEDVKSLVDLSAFNLTNTIYQIAIEAYNAFFWFLGMMLILEISIFIFSITKSFNRKLTKLQTDPLQQNSVSEPSQSENRTQKVEFFRQKRFIMYLLKIILIYSLCYFFYIIIFIAVYFASNASISQQRPFPQIGPSMENLRDRNLEEIYLPILEQNYSIGSNKTTKGNQRFLQALNSIVVQPLFEKELSVTSIVLSDSGTIAFLAVTSELSGNCTLQILNISETNSPQFLGNITFAKPPINKAIEYPDQYFQLALSSGGKTIFMSTGSILQITDVSDLNAPISISNYSLASNEYIQSISLTSDDNYALLGTTIVETILDSEYVRKYAIRSVNITDIQSIELISSIISPSTQTNNFYVSGESAFVSTNNHFLIFDLSDMQNPSVTSNLSFSLSASIQSFTLSFDYQTAFVIYEVQNNQDWSIYDYYFQIFNITQNAFLNTSQAFSLVSGNGNIVLSSDNIHLFVTQDTVMQIFDVSNYSNPIPFPQTELNSGSSFALCSDGKTLLSSDGSSFYIVELFLDIQATQIFHIQNNILTTFNLPNLTGYSINDIILSPNGTLLYVFVLDTSFNGYVLVADVSNPSSPVWLSSLQSIQITSQITISADGKYLFGVNFILETIDVLIYDFLIYDTSSLQMVSTTKFPYKNSNSISYLAITSDGDTALLMPTTINFLLLNISDRVNPSTLCNYTMSVNESIISAIEFVQNNQVAIFAGAFIKFDNSNLMIDNGLYIYDISLPSDPKFLASFELKGTPLTLTISADEYLAFTLTNPGVRRCTLNVVNISSITTMTLIGTLEMPFSCLKQYDQIEPVIVSVQQNTQVLLIPTYRALLAIDISTPTVPKLLDYYDIFTSDVVLAPDGSTLYIPNSENITIISFKPENMLLINPNSVSLGAQYTNTLNVLTKNSLNTYDASISNFKFINFFHYSPNFNDLLLGDYQNSQDSSGFKSLPNWVITDQNNGAMTFQPNSQYQIGSYVIYGSLSTQISNNTFINVGSINNTNDSFTLLTTLLLYGYVDNQFYLTTNFDPTQPLILPSQYQEYEPQYRSALAEYFLEAWTTIDIISSLTITLQEPSTSPPSTSPIVINTESLEPLTVIITLEGQGSTPMFVTIGYPFSASFSQNNSVVSMVQSLTDLNTTFPQLIIFLNGSSYCSGNISVTDGLNPMLNQFVPDMSLYFMISSQPSINIPYLLSQIRQAQPKTGEQFVVDFDSSTFTDSTNQPLTLTIQMQDSRLEVPQWLDLKEYTLKGIPPEQLTGRDLDLKLRVSNQYQYTETEFTLSVGISIEYAFKMIGTIGGPLITAIGLLVYASHIYNIFCKKRYRYFKDFVVRSGQEIVPKTLYPILFAEEPIQESRLIIEHIDKKISQQLKDKSRAKIAFYFAISKSEKIDQAKLSQAIEESAFELLNNSKTKLKHYFTDSKSQKEIITQLIINEFVVRLLDLQEQKLTKIAFNQIKEELCSFVDLDKYLQNGLCAFSVNKSKLLLKLKSLDKPNLILDDSEDGNNLSGSSSKGINLSDPFLESTELRPISSTTPPQQKLGVNIELIVAAMEAYACNYHVIEANITKVDVVGKIREANVWPFESIRRFLKRDLVNIGFSGKALVGYGIKYKVQKNLLVFYGTANENISGNTIVVQILNRKGKILKEIWINGVDAQYELEEKCLIEGEIGV